MTPYRWTLVLVALLLVLGVWLASGPTPAPYQPCHTSLAVRDKSPVSPCP